MINSALLLHMEVVSEGEEEEEEVKEKEEIQTQLKDDLAFGNKLIILGGDLLLARACRELAHLYVPKVCALVFLFYHHILLFVLIFLYISLLNYHLSMCPVDTVRSAVSCFGHNSLHYVSV